MRQQKLPEGERSWDLADETTGEQLAVVDLAWPRGIQEGLTGKVAVLIDEDVATHRIVARAGFRCFDSVQGFQEHVRRDVLVESAVPESRYRTDGFLVGAAGPARSDTLGRGRRDVRRDVVRALEVMR